MLKILLINPPFFQAPGRFQKSAIYTEPPLGIAYIASYLEEYRGGIDIKILDAAVLGMNFNQVVSYAMSEKPDILGTTSVTYTANFTKRLFSKIKKILPDTLTVTGGPHPTALPFDLLPEADICVLGEGEVTMCEILDYVQGKIDISQINGISYTDKKGQKRLNPARQYIQDLDTIPYPARHLLPMERYTYQYPHQTRTPFYSTVLGVRGCPFSCTFCGVKIMWGRRVRFRSAQNIIGELEELIGKYNVSYIHFNDDTFGTRKDIATELCREIIDGKWDIKWSTTIRVDVVDRELLRLMKKSGCVELQVGVESGDPCVLKLIKKGITREQVRATFKLFKAEGIQTKAFFMIGNEGEDKATILKTIRFALELDPTYAFFSIFIPFPGLPMFEEYKKKGFIKTFDWDKYNWYGKPVFETDTLTRQDLKNLQRYAEMRFFLRPKKMLRYGVDAIRARKLNVLKRNFFAFLDIVVG